MEINKEKIRYILQYYYNYTLSKSAAQKWFARFCTGNFDVKDESRSGRPITEKSDEIMEKVERDKHASTMEIARELGIDHKTVLNHLHKKKLDWVPHELSITNMIVKSFADSVKKKLRRLLNEVALGDRRPSQLLRRMRDLAQNGASEEVLKSLWLQRLPQQVQAILIASKHELEEVSQLADRITDVLSTGVNAVAVVTH
ncbi:SETMR methyltransferase, partial [Pseudoatta argentina]